MINQFSRTEMILGLESMNILKKSCIAVFGIGGVGSFAVESFARSGIGKLILIDNDKISITNLNRQIHADYNTVNKLKTEVMKERILNINPDVEIEIFNDFVLYDNIGNIIKEGIDYIVDAVDTVTAKIAIVQEAERLNIPVISCMGTGNKIYPEMLEIDDIYKTSVCPLAKVMRHEMKKRNIKKLNVCFSKEKPIIPNNFNKEVSSKRCIPGSVSFVPSVAGLMISGYVIRDLIKI